jgi:hypothetical protein
MQESFWAQDAEAAQNPPVGRHRKTSAGAKKARRYTTGMRMIFQNVTPAPVCDLVSEPIADPIDWRICLRGAAFSN